MSNINSLEDLLEATNTSTPVTVNNASDELIESIKEGISAVKEIRDFKSSMTKLITEVNNKDWEK